MGRIRTLTKILNSRGGDFTNELMWTFDVDLT